MKNNNIPDILLEALKSVIPPKRADYMAAENQYLIDQQMASLQNLEEIGGPDSLEQYIAVLTAVKAEIDKRIGCAKSQLADSNNK